MSILTVHFGKYALACCVLSLGLVHILGCGEEKKEREFRTINGTALSIDEATSKVAMSFYNKKKQIEVTIEGTVTPQTEILINGRVARLNEVQIGDKVTVSGYEEKDGARRRLVATKVQIDRAGVWSRASQPASQAASTAAPKPAKP